MRLLTFFFADLLGRRARLRTAIRSDAERMIASFRERAYNEARDRVRGRCVDGRRSTRYWIGVKREVARRQGIRIGLSGADSWR